MGGKHVELSQVDARVCHDHAHEPDGELVRAERHPERAVLLGGEKDGCGSDVLKQLRRHGVSEQLCGPALNVRKHGSVFEESGDDPVGIPHSHSNPSDATCDDPQHAP